MRPESSGPIECCQPPARTCRSSSAMCRASPMISPHVSSTVGAVRPAVPHTRMSSAAAASMSIAALPMPVVTSSLRLGSEASRGPVNGVRSRIATITS